MMPGYIVALSAEQLLYLINLVEEDLHALAALEDMEPAWVQDRIREVRGRRDYLQSIFNTGGNAK